MVKLKTPDEIYFKINTEGKLARVVRLSGTQGRHAKTKLKFLDLNNHSLGIDWYSNGQTCSLVFRSKLKSSISKTGDLPSP